MGTLRALMAALLATAVAAQAQTPSAEAPAAASAPASAASAAGPADADAPYMALLVKAVGMIRAHQSQQALDGPIAEVIDHYETQNRGRTEQLFCASNQTETLVYLLGAVAGKLKNADGTANAAHPKVNLGPNGQGSLTMGAEAHPAVIVLGPYWASAYMNKGSALIELGRVAEAREALKHAVALSPSNANYLGELAYTYQADKQWPQALETFTKAEEAAKISNEPLRAHDATRALRGEGYSLTELGRLDEAEAKYHKALELDPQDKASMNELVYIRRLREQTAK